MRIRGSLLMSRETLYRGLGLPNKSFSDIILSVAGNRQDDGSKPRLRVVDEVAEVTRLDRSPSKSEGTRKKTQFHRSQEQTAISQDLAVKSAESHSSEPIPDTATPSQEPPAPLKIPPILFYLAGGFFLLLLGLGIFMALGGRHRDSRFQTQQQARESIKLNQEEEAEAKKMVTVLCEALVGYASASTIEEKLRYARQPERVEPLMRTYYSKNELRPLSGPTLVSQFPLPVENRSFVVLTSTFDDADNKLFLAEVANDLSVRIDWESDVCYQPVDLADYLRDKPTESIMLRVYAEPDNFYVYEFGDTEKYQCLKLTFRDSAEHLFGYVEKENPTSNKLLDYLKNCLLVGGSKPEPMIVTVRFLENSQSERGVLIEEMVSSRWANIDEIEK